MRSFFIAALCVAICAAQAQSAEIPIWPGVAPGSEGWTQKELTVSNTPIGTVVLNVVSPTVTAYLPPNANTSRTGIIIAPGGYCVALAIDAEGKALAQQLVAHGIVAFVLKYRIIEKKQQGAPTDIDMDQACKYGMDDGIQAVKFIRRHAAEFGVSPKKIGLVGFSAGGMIASAALLQQDAADRPNFAALLYGAPFGKMPSIPQQLPPLFMAWAQDDKLAGGTVSTFYEALRASGNKPEAHIYDSGGHGFGMKKQGTTSDRWSDDFLWWLHVKGF